ncbi:hypothetical protein BX661DRAFT_181388 [Kickxella alabastrina]|uniref:uncharacterized protein n=1 Tax=Kickxella alabastrina TaxID=61397 RepID=UPI00221F1CF4|nr:uncharacterized protein BX661DRAFT_181388 [Kickxella alabastrina]KAI7829111.1 hypothetical protein BX661DRAFT_181388 [Kickxella alabastrina]
MSFSPSLLFNPRLPLLSSFTISFYPCIEHLSFIFYFVTLYKFSFKQKAYILFTSTISAIQFTLTPKGKMLRKPSKSSIQGMTPVQTNHFNQYKTHKSSSFYNIISNKSGDKIYGYKDDLLHDMVVFIQKKYGKLLKLEVCYLIGNPIDIINTFDMDNGTFESLFKKKQPIDIINTFDMDNGTFESLLKKNTFILCKTEKNGKFALQADIPLGVKIEKICGSNWKRCEKTTTDYKK